MFAVFDLFAQVNFLAVLAAAAIFFMIGSVWYSGLFGQVWLKELQRHNVVIQTPTTSVIYTKMVTQFALNLLAAFAVACLVIATDSTTAYSGLMLGSFVVLCAAVAVGSMFIWESRSFKLFLIDMGYPLFGLLSSAVLLSVWR